MGANSKPQKYTQTDKFLWIVTFAYLVVLYVIGRKPMVTIGFTLLVLIASNFKFTIYKYHIFTLQFCLYCYATTFWALNGRYTISATNDIFITLMSLFVFYEYWKNVRDINILLKIIMWAGVIVVIYTYYYYGVSNIVSSENEARLQNKFNNVNTIAMLTAIVLIINYYFMLFVKKDWSALIWIPCLMIISATQSRKAIVMLIIGVFFLYFFKQRKEARNHLFHSYTKIFFFSVIFILIIAILSQTSMFSGLADRMRGLIASVTGEGKEDASAMLRRLYREEAWKQFYQTPIVGCGINNSIIFLSRNLGHMTYTHCNYAELAACGGIIGLISYYSIFAYILFNELKYIKIESSAVLIVTWIMTKLVMDWGAVSYNSHSTYFYLMLYFIHLDNMKRKYPRIK